MIEILAWSAAALALLPLAIGVVNLWHYERLGRGGRRDDLPGVSVLVPARNEADTIEACLLAALANHHDPLQIVVMDDHSDDATADIVARLAARDPRVELRRAPALPDGWNGKQHACAELARAARFPILLFLDADVELAPDAIARLAETFAERDLDLLSGVPRQLTGSLAERLAIPLIQFVLLGFLPLGLARRTRHPAFAAGCGQLMAVRHRAYAASGGHAAIRRSRHDGLMLPRAVRRSGGRTDVFDATDVAACRMYRGAAQVWTGLTKNATEGLGQTRRIVPWSALLLGGQVVPPILLGAALAGLVPTALPAAMVGTATIFGFRLLLARRFGDSWSGVIGHPVGVLALVGAQWYALWAKLRGRSIVWKGRAETDEATTRRQASSISRVDAVSQVREPT